MKKNRLIAFALSVSLLLGASACGKPAKTVSELIAEENAILDQHQELWTTALNSLDKDNLSQSTQSTNYADVLDLAIKNVKDQLSDEDYKTLTDDAAKVRKLEDQLQELPPETAEANTSSAGDAFPSFEGKDLDGNAVDSSILSEAKLTVLNVWATYCTPCVNEMPDLETLSQNYKDKGVQVVGLVADVFDDEEKKAEAKEILSATGVTYVNLLPDTVLDDSLLYDITGTPTTLFLGSEGKILKIVEGTRDLDALTEMVDELLAAQE